MPRCRAPFGAAIALVALALGCRVGSATPPGAATTTGDEFDGDAAFARLRWLMNHPRTLGAPGRHASIDALAEELRAAGATVERDEHQATDPGTRERFELVNLIGHVRPEAPRRFVLATHFDTRPWADEDPDPAARALPVPGANDGSSGVAVVLELIPTLTRRLPPEVGFTVILFDGEELGRPDAGGYCMGSRHLAAQIRDGAHPLVGDAEFGIVLDMVGDRDLRVQPEPISLRHAPDLTARIWQAAADLDVDAFDPEPRPHGIVDDHRFLSEAGVPSVLLIDHDYAAWHTRADTLDRVSARSLQSVGRVVLVALTEHWRAPPPIVRDSARAAHRR